MMMMIYDIFILHQDSGVPLLTLNLASKGKDEKDPALFTGVLQGIRLFLKECKYGDLTDFTTKDYRVEVRCDEGVAVALVADLEDPSHDFINKLTEDIAYLFTTSFTKQIKDFSGNVEYFQQFIPELEEFINLYNRFSPPLACIIGKSKFLRALFYLILIKPAASYANHISNKY